MFKSLKVQTNNKTRKFLVKKGYYYQLGETSEGYVCYINHDFQVKFMDPQTGALYAA